MVGIYLETTVSLILSRMLSEMRKRNVKMVALDLGCLDQSHMHFRMT